MIRVADEVREALEAERGVVALETTLVAHGFPPGEGIEVGLASERAVRDGGAVPATVGVLDGEVVVGLTEAELERFDASARKLGPRDLAAAAVQGVVGATTVGGTLAVCWTTGIRFMATGGLGGVHRGWPTPPDVSADLHALAGAQALVVSSGVKSLLDVPATAELLETLGVPVLGWRTDELPLFYAARGGPRSPRASTRPRGRADRRGALGSSPAAASCWPGLPTRASTTSSRSSSWRSPRRPSRECTGRRDAVRALLSAPRERRPDAAREPRAGGRQRAACGRGRVGVDRLEALTQ